MTRIPEFTVVLGLDERHLRQLEITLPTWLLHKRIDRHPCIVFYDRDELYPGQIHDLLPFAKLVPWPDRGCIHHDQRSRMLAGFVHIPGRHVATKYWLKLDCDVIALPPSDWIDPSWFVGQPAIVAQQWGYTKPPGQMRELDVWAATHGLFGTQPLALVPQPGSSLLRHQRIISWCGFFRASATVEAMHLCSETGHHCGMPAPSQDGFMWYFCRQSGYDIIRVNMKERGWVWRSSMNAIQESASESMALCNGE